MSETLKKEGINKRHDDTFIFTSCDILLVHSRERNKEKPPPHKLLNSVHWTNNPQHTLRL